MPTQLDDTLSVAALNETERRAVARIVARLQAELGDDLLAVWLYGSRARGEADPSETDPDLRSARSAARDALHAAKEAGGPRDHMTYGDLLAWLRQWKEAGGH